MPGFLLNFESLKAWCDRQQFQYRANNELGQLAVNYQILDQSAPLLIVPMPERGMITLALRMPYKIEPARFLEVREAVTLLNATSYMGTWVLNSEIGDVYFRVTLPALDIEYSDQGLFFAARIVVSTAETVAPMLLKVVRGEAAPETVVPKVPGQI